ncbi:MAG: hypothetical protein ACR2G0_12725 [Chthoniobacterales bacterium]
MVTKKATRKKASASVRDLTARKDPKGGAQKKEGPAKGKVEGGLTTLKASKLRLS